MATHKGKRKGKHMEALLSLLFVPLIILNAFGGIVGGIWLAILGKWKLIGIGIGLSVLMPFAFSIAGLPAMGLTAIVAWGANRGYRIVVVFFGFLTSLWNNILILVWSLFVFGYLMVDAGTGLSSIPFYLWTHSTIMAPLGYMASKERDGGGLGTTFALLEAQVFFLLLMIGRLGFGGIWIPIVGVGVVLLGSLLLASLTAAMTQKMPKKSNKTVGYDDDEPYS